MKSIFIHLRQLWDEKPLVLIMMLAIITRLVSAVFSRGFGMHDDHFLVIEPAQAWLDGVIVPGRASVPGQEIIPDGHSLFYMGLHYWLFKILAVVHITDPEVKMLIVRLIHASLSLASVWMVYRITELVSGKRDASFAGLLMAVLWFMPMLGVRNLVEIACIPFILAGTWMLVLADKQPKRWYFLILAGIIIGLSISVRFQLVVFAGGAGLVLLLQRKWKQAVWMAAGVVLAFVVVQGVADYLIWGYPFAEFIEYVRYNLQAAYDYLTGPWYFFLLLLAGIFIPPVSLMLLFGYFRTWRKQLLIFLPSFLFLLFHSVFPNKQERFIFPVIPFIIIGGVIGWNEFRATSKFWAEHARVYAAGMWFFWIVNIALLIPVSVAFSKKSRVESMTYMQRYAPVKVMVAEDINNNSAQMLPRFYSKQWMQIFFIGKEGIMRYSADSAVCRMDEASFVFFYGALNLPERVEKIKSQIPGIEYDTVIRPGFVDRVMYTLNPVNRNAEIYIYRKKQHLLNTP